MTFHGFGEPVIVLGAGCFDQHSFIDWPFARCTRDQPGMPGGDLTVSQRIGSVRQLLKPGSCLDVAFGFTFR